MIVSSSRDGAVIARRSAKLLQPAVRPWWRSAYAGFLGSLLLLYIAGYGALLVATDGLPYVLDNNESFSTLLHATNLYQFGLLESYGITDEATGPDPAAHPFVHTHQGNFPRVWGFLLYAFGVRTIEGQIIVTTFTIGILAVLMAYHLFARLGGPLFACITCVVLLSDYIFVAQWHVNTYRVWHFFLVFSSLMCVYGLGSGRRFWLGLIYVNALALFYCELVSVAFTSLLAGFFAISLHWRRPRRVIGWTIAHTAGGLSSLLLLVAQLVAYLGWENFLTDVQLTFRARNFGASSDEVREQVVRFYEQNNILFWENFVDGAQLKSFAAFLDVHTRYVFQVYTPILTLIVLVVTAGWVLGLSWGYDRIWRLRLGRAGSDQRVLLTVASEPHVTGSLEIRLPRLAPAERRLLRRVNGVLRFALLFLPISIALLMILRDERIVGTLSAPPSVMDLLVSAAAALVMGAGASMALIKARTHCWLTPQRIPLWRLFTAAVLLLAVSLIVGIQPHVYDQAYRSLWHDPFASVIPLWVERIALVTALGLAVSMCLFGTTRVLGAVWTSRLSRLGTYLLCSGLAYAITYYLATGYVKSGYLTRAAPLPVFFAGVLVAFAACIVVTAAARGWSALPGPVGAPRMEHRWKLSLLGATAGLLVWMTGYWVFLNGVYITHFPPTQFASVYRTFTSGPLHGVTTVVDTYGTPIAVQSGNWTYYHPSFGTKDLIRLGPAGFERADNPLRYVWLADKASNSAYMRPEVFVCMRPRTFDTYATRSAEEQRSSEHDCASLPLIAQIERKRQRFLEHTLVDRDRGTPSTWAIVRLDWDFPPYLELPENRSSDDGVSLVVTPGPSNIRAQVEYTYAQQDGVPERQSTVSLHASGADGRWCVYERSSNRTSFTLPADFRGKLRASVTPRSTTKVGQEYVGTTLTIGDGQGAPCVGKE